MQALGYEQPVGGPRPQDAALPQAIQPNSTEGLLNRLGTPAPTEHLQSLGQNALGNQLQIGDPYKMGYYDKVAGMNMVDVGEVTGFDAAGKPLYKTISSQPADVAAGSHKPESQATTHLDDATPTTVMPPVKPPEQQPKPQPQEVPVQPAQAAEDLASEMRLPYRRPPKPLAQETEQPAAQSTPAEQPASTNEPTPTPSMPGPAPTQARPDPRINLAPPTEADAALAGLSTKERIKRNERIAAQAGQLDTGSPYGSPPQQPASQSRRPRPMPVPQAVRPVPQPEPRKPYPRPRPVNRTDDSLPVDNELAQFTADQQPDEWMPGGRIVPGGRRQSVRDSNSTEPPRYQ